MYCFELMSKKTLNGRIVLRVFHSLPTEALDSVEYLLFLYNYVYVPFKGRKQVTSNNF